jgi:hypothetical protein
MSPPTSTFCELKGLTIKEAILPPEPGSFSGTQVMALASANPEKLIPTTTMKATTIVNFENHLIRKRIQIPPYFFWQLNRIERTR